MQSYLKENNQLPYQRREVKRADFINNYCSIVVVAFTIAIIILLGYAIQ